jgi:N-acetylmuramoyl-L-alanine amidase
LPLLFLIAAFPVVVKIFPRHNKMTDNGNTKINTPLALQNNRLPNQAAKIMIDPGHGGTDSGVDKGNIIESEVTLDISKKLKTYLEDKSFNVEMTRSTDISLNKFSHINDTLQRRELDARATIINNSGARIFVSIHVNSYPEYPNISGSIVYYNPLMPQSKELSDCIQKQLNGINKFNFKRGTHNPQAADFYLLMNTNITGVLVETAFVTNRNEYKLLSQDDFRSQIAKGVADGIENYLVKL